jgi:Pyridoxamine 5'-phosphate oxidase
MGKLYEHITPELKSWLEGQKMFFVGTAPLSAQGHINCSPKGMDTFRILSSSRVAYLDLTGSGAETMAHLRENGRIVFMFCAFTGPPQIVRLHGQGKVHNSTSPDWNSLRPQFPDYPGVRSVISAEVTRVSDSCGYAVPNLEFLSPRDGLERWAKAKSSEELVAYRRQKNSRSIDQLPGWEYD